MPASDITIDFTNKVFDNPSGTDTIDVNAFFSYALEQFHLSGNAHHDFPLDSKTPSALDVLLGWICTPRLIQHITGGSIVETFGTDEIEQITHQSGGYTSAISSDIGKVVVGTGFAGDATLVAYDNTLRIWWVRTHGTATSVSNGTAITITSGTGAGTTTGASIGGDNTYANIKSETLLALDTPLPQMIYAVDGVPMTPANFAGAPDLTVANADRGYVDVLIPIKSMGVTRGLPLGTVQVLARDQISTYHDFATNIAGGGTTVIPTTTGEESKDTLGSHYLVINTLASGTPAADDLITATTGTLWQAKVVSYYAGSGSEGVLEITTPSAAVADDDAFGNGTWTAVARGTVGGQFYTYDTASDPITETEYGLELAFSLSSLKANLRGHLTLAEGAGGSQGAIVCESNHDVNADSAFYNDAVDNDVVTATGMDVTLDGVELNRRALDDDDIFVKTASWDLIIPTSIGDAAVGDDISQATSGAKGTIIEINSLTLTVSSNNGVAFTNTGGHTVTDDNGGTLSQVPTTATRVKTFEFNYQSASSFTYTGMINGAGKTVERIFHFLKHFQARGSSGTSVSGDDRKRELYLQRENTGLEDQRVDGQFFSKAFQDLVTPSLTFSVQDVKSPIALQSGDVLNAGQGWCITNVDASDANSIVSSDNSAITHIPLQSKSITLTGLPIGAELLISVNDGSNQEDEDQFGLAAGNNAGDTTIEFDSALPLDLPTGGADNEIVVYAVDIDSISPNLKVLRYRGASRSGSTVTLETGDSGTAEAGSGAQLLNDTAAFGNTQVGDVIRNITTGEYATVTAKPDANSVETTVTSGGSGWSTSDTWDSNVLGFTYDASDTAWIPYMSRTSSSSSEVVSVLDNGAVSVVIVIKDTSQKDFKTFIAAWSANASIANSVIPQPQYTPT